MLNFTPDFLFDSNNPKSTNLSSANGSTQMRSPKKQTIKNLLAFSKALDVRNGRSGSIEMVLN